MTNTRYPYTYACDYIRQSFIDTLADSAMQCQIPSRVEAARLRQKIATALGMSDEDLAKKLADAYLTSNAGTP